MAASTPSAGNLESVTTNAPRIGSATGLAAQMPDVRLYADRALSADDVKALYDESRRGYPTALRRYTPAAWSFPPSAPGNRRRRVLICGSGS